MTERSDIEKGTLIYTKRCGWIDLGHANPVSKQPTRGAANLLASVVHESGNKSKNGVYHKVTFGMAAYKYGIRFAPDDAEVAVRVGLSQYDKQAAALYIFLSMSMKFESLQRQFGSSSGFSAEDLPSNLIGFYKALHPGIDYTALCEPVRQKTAERVWDVYGGPTREMYKLGSNALDDRGLPRVILFPIPEFPNGPSQITLASLPGFLSLIVPSTNHVRPWNDSDPELSRPPASSQAAGTVATAPDSSGTADVIEVRVRPGDSLSALTKQVHGDYELWPLIWDLNRDVIGPNPDRLRPGTKLKIPPKGAFSQKQVEDSKKRAKSVPVAADR